MDNDLMRIISRIMPPEKGGANDRRPRHRPRPAGSRRPAPAAGPGLGDMGEYLLRVHDGRFDAQRAPNGTPWAPLSPGYAARKAKRRARAGILDLDVHLRRQAWQVDGGEFLPGTVSVYVLIDVPAIDKGGEKTQVGTDAFGWGCRDYGLGVLIERLMIQGMRECP